MNNPLIQTYLKRSKLPILSLIENITPWAAISTIKEIIINLMQIIDLSEYNVMDNQAIHKSSIIESTAQLKGQMVIGPSCFVANGSLLRDGIIIDAGCIIGHCSELKTSIMLEGSKIAHLNFVGDSILGAEVNVEAGAIIANYRNELNDKEIYTLYKGQRIATGVSKFGSIVGDCSKIGANAVLSPGTLLFEKSIIRRGEIIDQVELSRS